MLVEYKHKCGFSLNYFLCIKNGIPKGAKTSEFYKTKNIPNRFENPGKQTKNIKYIFNRCL